MKQILYSLNKLPTGTVSGFVIGFIKPSTNILALGIFSVTGIPVPPPILGAAGGAMRQKIGQYRITEEDSSITDKAKSGGECTGITTGVSSGFITGMFLSFAKNCPIIIRDALHPDHDLRDNFSNILSNNGPLAALNYLDGGFTLAAITISPVIGAGIGKYTGKFCGFLEGQIEQGFRDIHDKYYPLQDQDCFGKDSANNDNNTDDSSHL